jgi:AcrR family transcriptional regulator
VASRAPFLVPPPARRRSSGPPQPLYPKLHPGPGDEEKVRDHQRARLCGALIEAVCRYGYDGFSIRHLCALAGVSTRSFYSLYVGKHDCFLAAYRAICLQLRARALAGAQARTDLEAAAEGLLAALFELAGEQRRAARFLMIDCFSAGPLAVQAARENGELIDLCGELCRQAGLSVPPGWFRAAAINAVWRVARNVLLNRGGGGLAPLAPPLANYLVACHGALLALEAGGARRPRPLDGTGWPGAAAALKSCAGGGPAALIHAAFTVLAEPRPPSSELAVITRRAGLAPHRLGAATTAEELYAEAIVAAWAELERWVYQVAKPVSQRELLATLVAVLGRDPGLAHATFKQSYLLGSVGVWAREEVLERLERLLMRLDLRRWGALAPARAGALWGALVSLHADGALRREGEVVARLEVLLSG